MTKQQNKNFQTGNPDELKAYRLTQSVTKKPTYIYTEEDLGEGILDIGVLA